MIPKKIHQVWFGEELPEQYRLWSETIKLHHPNWEYKLWTGQELNELPYSELYGKCANKSSMSNVARLAIILLYGGVYLDTDIECNKPLDDLMDVSAFAGWEVKGRICSAVFGAEAQHEWMRQCLKEIPNCIFKKSPWSPSLMSMFLEGVTVYPTEYFYPYLWYETAAKEYDSYLVHHWERSWRHDSPSSRWMW